MSRLVRRRCSRCGAAALVAGIAATAVALAPAEAGASGAYGKLEMGSAIALAAVGGITFIPITFAIMDPPLTTQRIVGKSLVLAGSLTAIAFCVEYFAVDDPGWVPHGLGWGIGGGLILAGFITWLTDDTAEETAAPPGPGGPVPTPAGAAPGAAGTEGATSPPAAGSGGGEPTAPAPLDRTGPPGIFGFAPLVLPGGGGLLLAATW